MLVLDRQVETFAKETEEWRSACNAERSRREALERRITELEKVNDQLRQDNSVSGISYRKVHVKCPEYSNKCMLIHPLLSVHAEWLGGCNLTIQYYLRNTYAEF